MRRWLTRPFVWAWRAVGLKWLPARARLPVALALLYACGAGLLWKVLPPWPTLALHNEQCDNNMVWPAADGQTFLILREPPVQTTPNHSPDASYAVWTAAGGLRFLDVKLRGDVLTAGLSPRGSFAVGCRWPVDIESSTEPPFPSEHHVSVVDTHTGRELFRAPSSRPRMPATVAPFSPFALASFTPDEKTLAVAAGKEDEPAVVLWDVASRSVRAICKGASLPLAFSPDGTMLATGTGPNGKALQLWDTATGKPLAATADSMRHIRTMPAVFAPDGKTVSQLGIYVDAEERIMDWFWAGERHYDVATGKELPRAGGVRFRMRDSLVTLTPGFIVVVTGRQLEVFHAATGKRVAVAADRQPFLVLGGTEEWGTMPRPMMGLGNNRIGLWYVSGAADGSAVAVSSVDPTPPQPWRTGWAWLDEQLTPVHRYFHRPSDFPTLTTVYDRDGALLGEVRNWRTAGLLANGRQLLTVSGDSTQGLSVWEVPIRPPWPHVLGGAAISPGVFVSLIWLGRLWRQRRAPVGAA